MIQKRGSNFSRVSLEDIHEHLFLPFAAKVAVLVNAAKSNPGSNVGIELIQEADQWRNTLETICQLWTDNSNYIQATDGFTYSGPLWNRHDRQVWWNPAQGTVQHWSFDPNTQYYTQVDNPPQNPTPIDVQKLLHDFGSGQRSAAGVPPGKLIYGAPPFLQQGGNQR